MIETCLWCGAPATRWCDTPLRGFHYDIGEDDSMCSAPICSDCTSEMSGHINTSKGCSALTIDTCPACMAMPTTARKVMREMWRKMVRIHANGVASCL